MSINALVMGAREHATVLIALCFWQSLGLPPLAAIDRSAMSDLLDASELETLIQRLELGALASDDAGTAVRPHAVSFANDHQVDIGQLVSPHLPHLENPNRSYAFGNYERAGSPRAAPRSMPQQHDTRVAA